MIGANQYAAYNDTDQQLLGGTSPAMQSHPVREAFDADGTMTRRRRYEVPGFQHTPRPAAESGSAVPAPRHNYADQGCFYQAPAGALPSPNTAGRAVYEGMFHNISDWVEKGIAPPRAPLIETRGGKPLLDENGNVRGAVRLLEFSVPVASYGTGVKECMLTGWIVPSSADRLRTL